MSEKTPEPSLESQTMIEALKRRAQQEEEILTELEALLDEIEPILDTSVEDKKHNKDLIDRQQS